MELFEIITLLLCIR